MRPPTGWPTFFLPFVSFIPGVDGLAQAPAQSRPLGIFENHGEVGAVQRKGTVVHDGAKGTYVIEGGGENMWFTNDAMHFVWKKVSGDVTLAADISFPTSGGNAHRKACLMIRQTLDADSAYADAALHGDGLTSLQYRDSRNTRTYEVQSSISKPTCLRVEKRGKY